MNREIKSAEDIRMEIVRLIHLNREVREDEAKIGVSLPVKLVDCDSDGCNWSLSGFHNVGGHLGVAKKALEDVRRRWNMPG